MKSNYTLSACWSGSSLFVDTLMAHRGHLSHNFTNHHFGREDSYLPAHSCSLIRICTGHILDSQGCKCIGKSESSLGVYVGRYVFLFCGSFDTADNILKYFFLFSQKTGLDISCKLSPMETICMKCQILFSWKRKKTKYHLSYAELTQRVVKVNILTCYWDKG